VRAKRQSRHVRNASDVRRRSRNSDGEESKFLSIFLSKPSVVQPLYSAGAVRKSEQWSDVVTRAVQIRQRSKCTTLGLHQKLDEHKPPRRVGVMVLVTVRVSVSSPSLPAFLMCPESAALEGSLFLTASTGVLLPFARGDLAKHDHAVAIHECNAREALAVLEAVAH